MIIDEEIYTILLESGKYIIDKTIKMSPYIKLKPNGQVEFYVTHKGTGLWITPDAADPKYWNLTNQGIHQYKNSWMRGEFIDGSNSALIFSTTINRDAATTKTIAIEIAIPYADVELIDTTKGILVFAKNNMQLIENRTIYLSILIR